MHPEGKKSLRLIMTRLFIMNNFGSFVYSLTLLFFWYFFYTECEKNQQVFALKIFHLESIQIFIEK